MAPGEFSPLWKVVDTNSVWALRPVEDELLGYPVWDVYGLPFDARTQRGKSRSLMIRYGAGWTSDCYVVEALVRFPVVESGRSNRPHAIMTLLLSVGLIGEGESSVPAYGLEVGVGGFSAGGGRLYSVLGWTGKGNGASPWTVSGRVVPNLTPADISPFSPEMFRLETEAELDRMPRLDAMWIPLRIEVWRSFVRMYAHGWLVAEKSADRDVQGAVAIEFRGPARLAALTVRARDANATAGFVPVPLDARCNGTSRLSREGGEALRGDQVLHGIPWVLPTGSPFDFVDVGQSVFRFRMGTSYSAHFDPRVTTPEPNRFEPGRIQLIVPARAYRRAWLLAAAEEKPHHVPRVTLRFYKPYTAWSVDAAAQVPSYAEDFSGDAIQSVLVQDLAGRTRRLWLVPVELDAAHLAAEFQGEDGMALELTKEIRPNIGWPDPANYSYQAGGLPSSVHLYGLTLEEAPVWAYGTSGAHGNTFTDPQTPVWQVLVSNQTDRPLRPVVEVAVITPYGESADRLQQTVSLAAREAKRVAFSPRVPVWGLYEVRTTVSVDDWQQSRKGALLRLPAFARRETPQTSPWGVWDWSGGHGTNPNREENARLLVAFGAINHYDLQEVDRRNKTVENLYAFRKKWGLGADHYRIIGRTMPEWVAKDPIQPADREAYRHEIGQRVRQLKEEHPDLLYVNCFAENSVSLRTTHGVRAWALGLPEYELTGMEQRRVRQMLEAARAGALGVRQYAPDVKFLFGHCAANFFWPFFRESDWDWDLFAGFGLDLPQFERMPERQPRATEPSLLYFLKKELEQRGYASKELVHLESYFPASHELALGYRGQADSIVRTAVLSLALGTTKFMHTWSLHDCADRWGSQHYGCCGLIARHPEYNPKPAAAAFATMTRMLDMARYDGWMATGSFSAFCVRFRADDRWVYAVWTIRGSRPLRLRPAAESVRLERVDENGNLFDVHMRDGEGEVVLTPTPQWIVARGGSLAEVHAGDSFYTEGPGPYRRVLDDFERVSWRVRSLPYPRFASNHWDVVREAVPLQIEPIQSADRTSAVLRVSWAGPYPTNKPCVGFYAVLEPSQPIRIPGQARALGMYGKGASQWFRVVYELQDAQGETWLSCGQKDAWNADDIHSWSYFNHDGWRYMEFSLPANAPGDHYREASSYSWGCDEEGIVDLPLTLTRVIIEMRTHVLYVNEMLPVTNFTIELDDLMAVYDTPYFMTDEPVRLQRAAYDVWRPTVLSAVLPNPIETLREKGVGDPPVIERIYPPEEGVAGDQVYVRIQPVAGARQYTVYVSAYEDGRGAQAAGQVRDPQQPFTIWVNRLQPAIPMYFFATWTDKEGRESKPSTPRKTVLRDEFPFK